MPKRGEQSAPKQMQPVYDEITGLTDAFCKEHLDDEYAELARKMAAALARKRPSPLSSGKPQTWAGGIIYALGQVNFLFDKTQTPHMRADEIGPVFGVANSSCANKAKTIRDALKIHMIDTEYMRRDMVRENPMVWMISVNGLIVDARHMPREIQEEAHMLGLIPYVPGAEDG